MTWNRRALLQAGVMVALVVASLVAIQRYDGDGTITVSAEFSDATGVYVGNQVTVMGVRVGTVTEIVPDGTVVKVVMKIDEEVSVPKDAGAVILQDSLVADRYVGLAPAYVDGPTLADGAVIPLERARSPIGFDDLMRSVDSLFVALGESEGSQGLGELIEVGADNLAGNGQHFREALAGVADASATLAGNDEDLVRLVENTDLLVRMLAERNTTVAAFSDDITAVSQQFASDRHRFGRVIRGLATTLHVVNGFVKRNRELVTRDVRGLADVTAMAVRNREGLVETINQFPLVMQNMWRLYDPRDRRMVVYPELTQLLRDGTYGQQVCDPIPMVCDQVRDQLVSTTGQADDLLYILLGGLQ